MQNIREQINKIDDCLRIRSGDCSYSLFPQTFLNQVERHPLPYLMSSFSEDTKAQLNDSGQESNKTSEARIVKVFNSAVSIMRRKYSKDHVFISSSPSNNYNLSCVCALCGENFWLDWITFVSKQNGPNITVVKICQQQINRTNLKKSMERMPYANLASFSPSYLQETQTSSIKSQQEKNEINLSTTDKNDPSIYLWCRKILELKKNHLLEQICLLDSYFFNKINWDEFENGVWMKKNKTIDAPNIVEMTKIVNRLTLFICCTILSFEKPQERAKTIRFFIKLASNLHYYGDFNGATFVVSSLLSFPINRLKQSWIHVSHHGKKKLKALSEIYSYCKDTGEYDVALNSRLSAGMPVIPYLGRFLSKVCAMLSSTSNKSSKTSSINMDTSLPKVMNEISESPISTDLPFQFETYVFINFEPDDNEINPQLNDDNESFSSSSMSSPNVHNSDQTEKCYLPTISLQHRATSDNSLMDHEKSSTTSKQSHCRSSSLFSTDMEPTTDSMSYSFGNNSNFEQSSDQNFLLVRKKPVLPQRRKDSPRLLGNENYQSCHRRTASDVTIRSPQTRRKPSRSDSITEINQESCSSSNDSHRNTFLNFFSPKPSTNLNKNSSTCSSSYIQDESKTQFNMMKRVSNVLKRGNNLRSPFRDKKVFQKFDECSVLSPVTTDLCYSSKEECLESLVILQKYAESFGDIEPCYHTLWYLLDCDLPESSAVDRKSLKLEPPDP